MSHADSVSGFLVGVDFRLAPYQSAFGCVARIARLNQVSGIAAYQQLLGVIPLNSQNLLEILSTSRSQHHALASALGVAQPPEWDLAHWYPFQSQQLGSMLCARLRYCLACIRVGFHTTLHQLPWVETCPWHRVRLRVGCPRCGKEPNTFARTRIRLLMCTCGCDLMNESLCASQRRPLEGAKAYLERYLDWAAAERGTKHLITLDWTRTAAQQLSCMVELPDNLAPTRVKTGRTTKIYVGAHRSAARPAMIQNEESRPFACVAANISKHPMVQNLAPLDRSRLGLSDPGCPSGASGPISSEIHGPVPSINIASRLAHLSYHNLSLLLEAKVDQLHLLEEAQRELRAAIRRAQRNVLARAYAESLMAAVMLKDEALPVRYRPPSPIAILCTGTKPCLKIGFF